MSRLFNVCFVFPAKVFILEPKFSDEYFDFFFTANAALEIRYNSALNINFNLWIKLWPSNNQF
jgi:hypothetical protein